MIKFIIKNFCGHTVDTQVDEIKELALILINDNKQNIRSLVDMIATKQKINPRYNYASNEQLEIDRLVYEAYGLNEEDINEVENWYARRYPRLAQVVQEEQP